MPKLSYAKALNRALTDGRVPANETFDGAMIILGGALLLTPGFLTDAFGLILLIREPNRVMLFAFTWFTLTVLGFEFRPGDVVCAGIPGTYDKDACYGDSGGPLADASGRVVRTAWSGRSQGDGRYVASVENRSASRSVPAVRQSCS